MIVNMPAYSLFWSVVCFARVLIFKIILLNKKTLFFFSLLFFHFCREYLPVTNVLVNWYVQAHAASAVLNFSENCTPDILTPYLDGIVSKLLVLLQVTYTTFLTQIALLYCYEILFYMCLNIYIFCRMGNKWCKRGH